MTRHHTKNRSTATRIDNLRRLVAELQQRAMRVGDVCALLDLKRSGARGYIDDLRSLLEVTRGPLFEGGYVYQLIDDAEQAADYLANLGTAPRNPGESKSQMATATRAGRRFHILQDDCPYHIKVSRIRIPEQWAVHAAFWAGREVRA